MGKWKTAEAVLVAISALVAAAKAVIKFIVCLGKMRNNRKASAPA